MKKNSYSKDLLQDIAVRQSLTMTDTIKASQFLIEQIRIAIINNIKVRFVGFVVLFRGTRKAKRTTHPITNQVYLIPARSTVKAQFSKFVLKEFLN